MSQTRQYLVTLHSPDSDTVGPAQMANRIAEILVACSSVAYHGMVERGVMVIPLLAFGDDDSALEIGFRKLVRSLNDWSLRLNPEHAIYEPLLAGSEIRALIAALSKQHPARTGDVDRAALEAMIAIRESDRAPGLEVQRNARAQLIIIDAICRCLPEDKVDPEVNS